MAVLAEIGTSTLSRARLYGATMALLVANAIISKILHTLANNGAGWALASGLGAGWAFWVASAACLRLALTEAYSPARPRDLWLCAGFAAAALLPASQVSAAACTALGLIVLADRTQGARMKGAALILIAISIQLFWSRLLMLLLAQPLADLDAHVVSLIINRPVVGNDVEFVDGSARMAILGACTSVENLSTGLMFFVAVARTFRPAPKAGELVALAGLMVTVMALNYARLALMAQNQTMFHFIHADMGWPVIEAMMTFAGLAWAIGTVRREAFA